MIQVERLTKKFQTHTALNQISVSVQPGSVFGLVGSNGAGKSTLLRTIAGIYKPDSGTVAIDGTPIFEHPNVKNDIFFISDFPYFIPQSNMKEMAKFYASMYSNWSHERYRELCNLFPIEEKMKNFQHVQRNAKAGCFNLCTVYPAKSTANGRNF